MMVIVAGLQVLFCGQGMPSVAALRSVHLGLRPLSSVRMAQSGLVPQGHVRCAAKQGTPGLFPTVFTPMFTQACVPPAHLPTDQCKHLTSAAQPASLPAWHATSADSRWKSSAQHTQMMPQCGTEFSACLRVVLQTGLPNTAAGAAAVMAVPG